MRGGMPSLRSNDLERFVFQNIEISTTNCDASLITTTKNVVCSSAIIEPVTPYSYQPATLWYPPPKSYYSEINNTTLQWWRRTQNGCVREGVSGEVLQQVNNIPENGFICNETRQKHNKYIPLTNVTVCV